MKKLILGLVTITFLFCANVGYYAYNRTQQLEKDYLTKVASEKEIMLLKLLLSCEATQGFGVDGEQYLCINVRLLEQSKIPSGRAVDPESPEYSI